jgi:hypothetical protein
MNRTVTVLRRLGRDRRGVTAIEFAIVAPVLLLLMFGIIEFSLIMFASNMMEGATAVSSRLGKTGYVEDGQTREETIINAIRSRTDGFLDTNLFTVTSKFYKQYDQINDPEPWNDTNGNGVPEAGEYTDINGNGQWDSDMAQAGYGGADDVVVYTISYPWPIITPIMREVMGNAQGNFTITAHAVVKNEPYDD